MGLGIGRAFKKATGGGLGSLLGGVTGGLLGGLFGKFTSPGVQKMSAAERKALADQKAEEDARRSRLLEAGQRRTRVALGSVGGARSLLYGGGTMAGTQQPVIDTPLDTSIKIAPNSPKASTVGNAQEPAPAGRRRRGAWMDTARSVLERKRGLVS